MSPKRRPPLAEIIETLVELHGEPPKPIPRTLLRLGYGREAKSYATTYRSVLEALESELPAGAPALWRAHQLLRTHGQRLCKRSAPECDACPLAPTCPSAS